MNDSETVQWRKVQFLKGANDSQAQVRTRVLSAFAKITHCHILQTTLITAASFIILLDVDLSSACSSVRPKEGGANVPRDCEESVNVSP